MDGLIQTKEKPEVRDKKHQDRFLVNTTIRGQKLGSNENENDLLASSFKMAEKLIQLIFLVYFFAGVFHGKYFHLLETLFINDGLVEQIK